MPKDKEDRTTQTYAALGVGFVCVVIGLPLWWKTTEVYRVSLPYGDIADLSNTKVKYTVDVAIINGDQSLSENHITQLSRLVSDKLETSEDAVAPYYRLNVRDVTEKELAKVKAMTSLSNTDSQFPSGEDDVNRYQVVIVPKLSPLSLQKPYLSLGRTVLIQSTGSTDIPGLADKISTVIQKSLIKETSLSKIFHDGKGTGDRTLKPEKSSMRSVRSNPGYDITFTLVNPQPDILDVHWDIEQAVKDYLDPFLQQLQRYAKINVQSQVLYFTGFLKRMRRDDGKQAYLYTDKDLPHVINPLEAKLGSHTSNNPALNFLVYVPSRDQHPIYIVDSKGVEVQSNSFLSPQWGGIYIQNAPSPSENDTLPVTMELDMRRVMEVFISQLRLLLNFQSQKNGDTLVADVGSRVISKWELDGWLRSRCLENLGTSIATLQSLAQLLGEISNIVIQDDIGEQVQDAVNSIQESQRHLVEGRLEKAFLESRNAIVCSEKAFFDPSLLELLYFPEDQKFAIYIPLFLPISLPVLASLWKAFKWMKEERKQKTE
ncbi:GPI transamidase component PIG-S-like [Mizuhopecten yessoensis]|uniref:GPI transamidase component PIG-S n=1 Tax=Mizuhopecten yessoensis TaxID=6573 RepID=A0A210PHM7_MIZYE|nr:GPI transamidase component PIG-S-like [Mizuhopecten yessoensis]OWF35994.1 GPI transamidase component PIG-S [Mizuhopecten yessoensis]